MAIRTFSAQDRYRTGGTEPRKKLKKVRSVKVANLDKLRLSMKRDQNRFYHSVEASVEETTEPSESNSAAISGTSTPNYMKATTSSSARKGSSQGSSGSAPRNETSAASVKLASKHNRVSVQDYSDPAGVYIPVKVKPDRSLKRVLSLRNSNRLLRKKSMRIRARYSQFSDGIYQGEITDGGIEIETESLNSNNTNDQDFKIGANSKQKGILERSRSRNLTRLRSVRSSKTRQIPKSRFSGGGKQVVPFDAEVLEPHYMKATTSQQARKNSEKGLARTSSLRPLRILAKIPSLRPKRSKVKKRPQNTPLWGTSVHRPTCSSTLKRNQVPNDTKFQSGDQELDETSSLHVCPYSYCSIHGHRHHTPAQPLKEFISAKRKLFSNQKGQRLEKQSREGAKDVESATESEFNQLGHKISNESYAAVHEVMSSTTENDPEDENEDDGMDFLIKIYAKPRKKWATEVALNQDAEALNIAIYDQINGAQYEEKFADTFSEPSGVEEKRGALNDSQEISLPCDISPKSVSVDETLESSIAEYNPFQLASRASEARPRDYRTNILSDKQKYTSMWQLIHQELVSNEASMSEALGHIQEEEQESDYESTCDMSNKDVDEDIAERKTLEQEQTAAIKLVQGALKAILQHGKKSYNQQSEIVQEATDSIVRDENLREGGQKDGKEINLDSAEKQHIIKQIGSSLLGIEEPKEQGTVGEKLSKNLSKLRKMFMTAKFIKEMEGLKKINPQKPHFLSAEPVLENEKVYLRHLSIKERKNTEEWMLDCALKQVISWLDPDEQRRVAQLVEAFQRIVPEQEEMSQRHFPLARSTPDQEKELAVPMNGGKKEFVEPNQELSFPGDQLVEKQDAAALENLDDVPEAKIMTEEYTYLMKKTDDETMQESAETEISSSTLVLSEKNSKSASLNKETDNEVTVDEKSMNTREFSSENPIQGSEVSPAGDMTSIFINKQKYTSMWNMIYQHVSGEVSDNENQEIEGLDEEEHDGEANRHNNRDSTSSSHGLEPKEDNHDKNVTSEKPDLDQSTAIKLVKEALGAILKNYEQPTQTKSNQDHDRALDDSRDLRLPEPASHTDEKPVEVENSSLPLKEVESGDKFKEPQRKMSKSLSKLKKAIATTRFIKAMERLMKSSPRKSQISPSDTTSEEEKVYLRHRSIKGRKKDEEWMLDYALRQVVSKLDPDQQRRVAALVEAFETMHPEQKDMRVRIPLKGEATDCESDVKGNISDSQQQQSTSIKKDHHKQDDDIVLSTRGACPERSLQERDPQASSADSIPVKEINKPRILDSTLESSERISKLLASAAVKLEEPSVRDEETGTAMQFPSSLPTENAEVKPQGEMTSILFDKQKYTSMWHLIYQQVLSNEASTADKQEFNDDDEEQGSHTNSFHASNDPGSTQSIQLKKTKVDDDNQSSASDQSAAIYMVKEAISAILQCHEQRYDEQSLQDPRRDVSNSRELCGTAALVSTSEYDGSEGIEKRRDKKLEEKIHNVVNKSAPLQQQREPKEAMNKMSKSLSKLKRAIVTTKFIKAMERLRKISPRKPRLLPAEATSEEERVYPRYLSINARKNDEEWMLDYALRKVISDLAPVQQRKVAQLVEAFETVNPKQKGDKNSTRAEWDRTVHGESKADNHRLLEYKQESSTACDGNTLTMHSHKLNMIQTRGLLEKNMLEDQSINLPNLKMESPHKICDSEDSNSDMHHEASLKGTTVNENILTKREKIDDAKPMHEPIELAIDSEKDKHAGITKELHCDKQKNSSMWLLLYQHVKSFRDAESGSKQNESMANEDQSNKDNASAEMTHDDSVDRSVATELTENDAVKLVREAINDILDAPQGLENELSSGNKESEDHKKSLYRANSKLKKLLICNKLIKAMQTTQKFYPRKQPSIALNSVSEMGKTHLKTSAVGEKMGMDEWMIDNVLQKAIAGLAPIKQRRVALLVEAFEKANSNPEERGKGPCCTKTEFPDAISLEGDTKARENTKTLQSTRSPYSFDRKLEESTTFCSEVATLKVQQETHEDRSPVLTKEFFLNGGNRNFDSLCNNKAVATSAAIDTLSYSSHEPTEIDGANKSKAPVEETITFKDEEDAQYKKKISTFANKSLQQDDLEGELNHGAQDNGSLRKSTSLWGLILQRVTTDMLEKDEVSKPMIDVDVQEENEEGLEREIDKLCQPSSNVKSSRDMGVQTPASFDFEEDEAIKLVEEAVEEMLLVQDQLSDTESVTSSTISEQEVYSQNNEDHEERSATATQLTGAAESLQLATPDEEKLPTKEKLLKSYSTLSKVMMCKRFVKAMDKRRKFKAASTQEAAQPPHTEENIPTLRQITGRDKKSLEDGMLDHALQKVIGNLAPAKKQRVALLVKAFEAVGSQPEPTNSWRNKVSA